MGEIQVVPSVCRAGSGNDPSGHHPLNQSYRADKSSLGVVQSYTMKQFFFYNENVLMEAKAFK